MRPDLLATAVLLGSSGCMSTQPNGIRIGDETIKQFKAGKTPETWVLAILGTPSSTAVIEGEDDVHVLRYSMVQERTGLLSIFGSSTVTVSTVYFVIRKGVVETLWADRAEVPGLFTGGDAPGEKKE
jgi:hypothetical protein